MKAVARPLSSSAGDWLVKQLSDAKWLSFRACVAYLKQSGSKHVGADIHAFSRRASTTCRVAVGISSQGTSLEGVQDIWRILDGHGEFHIVDEGPKGRGSFHPKGYVFSNATHATMLIGSANLTEGGLYTNHELSVALDLDLGDTAANAFYGQIMTAFDDWQDPSAWSRKVTPALVKDLYDRGDLPSEATLRIVSRAVSAARKATAVAAGTVPAAIPASGFGASPAAPVPQPKALPSGLPAAPVIPKSPAPVATSAATPGTASVPSGVSGTAAVPAVPVVGVPATATRAAAPAGSKQFFIEVRPQHNGEVFLSYTAIKDDAAFFGHPFTGWTTPKQAQNKPYPQLTPDPVVDIVVYDKAGSVMQRKPVHTLNVVDYTRNHEIRITVPDGMQRHIPGMSVLVMTANPTLALDYRLEFYPPGTAPASVAAKLTHALPGGGKAPRHYGWS